MTPLELDEYLDHNDVEINDETLSIAHHGILGQKWGIRRYQNPDGSLTNAGKKHYYKQSLRADKKYLKVLESKAWDSSRFADAYYKKADQYYKKYAKAAAKDPTESDPKTQRLRNTYGMLATDYDNWSHYNSVQMREIKDQLQRMVDKYPDTKIKDINVKTTKYGAKYVNNTLHQIHDFLDDTQYKLYKNYNPNDNTDYYNPVKIIHNADSYYL